MMQSDEYTYIENLLERFFEGETSNAEERELYAFFARPDLPEYLKSYRPVFEYFETGIADEVKEDTPVSKPSLKVPFMKKWLWIGIAVAASLLLFLLLNKGDGGREEDFNPYAGSYIIRNGVKTEIPEEVARELDKVIRDSEKRQYEKERQALRPVRQHRETMENIERIENESGQLERRITRLEEHLNNK